MSSERDLEEAVDWFFNSGYKILSRSKPNAPTQSQIGSAYAAIMRVGDLMKMSPSDVILFSYQGHINSRRKAG